MIRWITHHFGISTNMVRIALFTLVVRSLG
jgi:hypothetical protein